MSSISTDYGGYYVKHLSDLEDQLKSDYKRKADNAREDVNEIEARFKRTSNKKDEDISKVAEKIRDDFSELQENKNEENRKEMERIRSMNYDRYGRNRAEACQRRPYSDCVCGTTSRRGYP